MPIPVSSFLPRAINNILHAVVSGAINPTPLAKVAAKFIQGIDKMPFGADIAVQMGWNGGIALIKEGVNLKREVAEGLHNIHGPSSAANLNNLEIQEHLDEVAQAREQAFRNEIDEVQNDVNNYFEMESGQLEFDLQEYGIKSHTQQEMEENIENAEEEVEEIEEVEEAVEIEQLEIENDYDYSYVQ